MYKVPYIIIMGAAVEKDGDPSGTMKRRVSSALRFSQKYTESIFMVTGGIGRNKTTSEAKEMKSLLLESGIPDKKIKGEDRSIGTLSSIYLCSSILKNVNNCMEVFVCSDQHQVARCRWLFFILGIQTQAVEEINGQNVNSLYKWKNYYFREFAAIVLDTISVYLHKAGIRKIR